MSEGTLRFKVYPITTKDGIRYITKESKLFGKYLRRYQGGFSFTTVVKEQSSKWESIKDINTDLVKAFGNNYVIEDNYL